jgi:hypothetical protein
MPQETIVKKLFSTTDLLLSAVLRTKDFELTKWDMVELPNGRKKVMFYFDRTPELEEEVKIFLTTDCPPYKKFFGKLKELKNIIYTVST